MATKGKVLIVVTSNNKMGDSGKQTGWYLPEVAHPYYVFKEANYGIDFVSPKGGQSPLDEGSEQAFKDDKVCQSFKSSNDIDQLLTTKKPSDVKASDYKVIFYAGGHGPMFDLPDNNDIAKLCEDVYKANGVVAAVCHGTVGLIPVKNPKTKEALVKDKLVTSFTNDEEDAVQLTNFMPFALETKLKDLGAKFVSVKNFAANVTECDRIMTGQNPASAEPLAKAIVEYLKKSVEL